MKLPLWGFFVDCWLWSHLRYHISSNTFWYLVVSGSEMEMGARAEAKVCGHGDAEIAAMAGSNILKYRLRNALHLQDFEYSLMSFSYMDKNAVFNTIGDGCCRISKGGRDSVTGFMLGSPYLVGDKQQSCTLEAANFGSSRFWPKCLSHVNEYSLAEMAQRRLARKVSMLTASCEPKCTSCVLGDARQLQVPHLRCSSHSSGKADLVHTDVCRPIGTVSVDGARNFITFLE